MIKQIKESGKKTNRNAMLKYLCFTLCMFTLISMFTIFSTVCAECSLVSPALTIIANSTEMSKSCLCGNKISFTADDFENSFGISKIESIKVIKLPPETDGKLYLGTLPVVKNQTISRSNLKHLSFAPNTKGNDALESSFSFLINSKKGNTAYTVSCSLYVLPELNFSPTLSLVNDSYLNVETQKNISYYGCLKAVDPENDRLTFKITGEPSKGIIRITDKNNGSYCYTPTRNYTGRDSFEYQVYDKYGNCSEKAVVSIKVSKAAGNVVYSDMLGHWAHNAAIKVCAADIMHGETVGNTNIFNPTAAVSRAEFLMLAMKAAGIKADQSLAYTVFADDDEIPLQYKPYVAKAYEMGIIKGSAEDNKLMFYPNTTISRAEAAVILNNILCAEQPSVKPVFADSSSVPSWAEDALYALNEIGVFAGIGEGNISPFAKLDRAMTAQILCAAMDL